MTMAVMPGQIVAETPRLCLHAMSDRNDDDAALMLALLNDPGFIRHIADRGVRTLDQARAYLRDGALRSYAEHGFGMYAVRRKDTGALIGNCGLVSSARAFALTPSPRTYPAANLAISSMVVSIERCLAMRERGSHTISK